VNDRGTIVKGTVKEVEPKEAVIELAPDVLGVLKASEISVDRVEDARNVLKPGEEIEVKIISVDRKNRNIGLSIKAKDIEDERSAVRDHRSREAERPTATTLGDLIKAQMDQDSND
jgi:small subunit ribosomal protein S1